MLEDITNEKVASWWQAALTMLKAGTGNENEVRQIERHFSTIVSVKLVGQELHAGVREVLMVDWFTQLYLETLTKALHFVGLPAECSVKFVVEKNGSLQPKPIMATIKPEIKKPAPQRNKAIPSTLPLEESYTFENFVRGPSNSFAHAAATAVSKNPGKTVYNPLFIWGGTGLGKTHLMQAIGHQIKKDNPDASVCFITSETFLNEYINAIMNDAMPAFRARYRKVDILLLDDVQFFAGKQQFQEEFFNTFNSLMTFRKQIVMTCDVAPRDLHGLEERLLSRFSAGMVVEIESPSYETRLAILKSKEQTLNRSVPENVLNYIAENIRSHVRALEGALQQVITFSQVNPDIPLDLELAQKILKNSVDEEEEIKDFSIDDIIKTVAETYGVSVQEILSSKRTQTLVVPRQLAMFLARTLTTRSLKEIGEAFDKNHSTIVHGQQEVQKRLDTEPKFRAQVEDLITKFGRKVSDVLKSDILHGGS